MASTRAETNCWFLGHLENCLDEKWISLQKQDEQDVIIPLAFNGKPKLPTKRQVLKLLMFYKKGPKMKITSTGEIADMVLDETYRYWKIANIPVMTRFFAKKKLTKIFDDYLKLSKHKKRESGTENMKRVKFNEDLDKLFDVAAEDAEEKIRKDRLLEEGAKCEDILFLDDQRGPRLAWISVEEIDYSYSKCLQDKSDRLESVKNLNNNEKKRKEQSTSKVVVNENVEDNSKDVEYKPKKKKKDTVTLEVPRNIFADPELTAMLDRTKCTDRVTTGVVASVIKAAGGNLNDFVISKDTVRRQRNKKREVIAAKVKEDFKVKKPKYVNLHWDGKLVGNFLGIKDERLTVLVSYWDTQNYR